MRVCRDCAYFNKIEKSHSLTGKCKVEPSDIIVGFDRPACRYFQDKNNNIGEDDEEGRMILVEST